MIERKAPGLSITMMRKSLDTTPMAMRSIAVCGIRRRSIVVNLSRSMKGSQECLETIVPALPHAIDLLRDARTDVTATHHAMQSQSPVIPLAHTDADTALDDGGTFTCQ